jgi:hypothetical protein
MSPVDPHAFATPPAILSWHVHITYFLTQPSNIQGALDLRSRTAQHFAPYLGPECDGRYDFGYLCLINDHNFANETLAGGPFPVGEWSIFVPWTHYSLVVPWMVQNRGIFISFDVIAIIVIINII